MKNNEMQQDLIRILNRYSMRRDLVNRLFVDVNSYEFRFDLSENDKWEYYIWVCKELGIRDRVMRSKGIDSDGGRKMKIEGHINEQLVCDQLLDTTNVSLIKEILKKNESISEVICDGIKSKKIESILDKKTTSRCDIKVKTNIRTIKLSIKKSESGQVHINKVNSFINGYEKLYSPIPNKVKDGLLFLFSGHSNTISILNDKKYQNKNKSIHDLEIHHETLSVETMNVYDSTISESMLQWVKSNIKNIATIVFKTGWAKNDTEWVDYIFYVNKVNDDSSFNNIFVVDMLIDRCVKFVDDIKFGVENGGTTILLPFGSLQYHLGGLQFHHNRKKILKITQ